MTRALSRERRDVVDRIVAGIVADMMAGRWLGSRNIHALAQQHGVSPERVKDWSTEAGRLVRVMDLVDRDDLLAQHRARMAARAEMARALHDEAKQVGEYSAAVGAVASWREEDRDERKLLGLNAPEKHQHAHVVATYEQLDAPSRLAQLDDAIATLTAERDALRAETALEAKRVPGASSGQHEGMTEYVLPGTTQEGER